MLCCDLQLHISSSCTLPPAGRALLALLLLLLLGGAVRRPLLLLLLPSAALCCCECSAVCCGVKGVHAVQMQHCTCRYGECNSNKERSKVSMACY